MLNNFIASMKSMKSPQLVTKKMSSVHGLSVHSANGVKSFHMVGEVKSAYRPIVAHQAGAYPGFCCMFSDYEYFYSRWFRC